ncbi:MAG: hypothetical protein ABR525_07160 [Candidatus Limnocylindria bacterium]
MARGFKEVPAKEKGEVLAAFAAHKGEVTEGYAAPRRADVIARPRAPEDLDVSAVFGLGLILEGLASLRHFRT